MLRLPYFCKRARPNMLLDDVVADKPARCRARGHTTKYPGHAGGERITPQKAGPATGPCALLTSPSQNTLKPRSKHGCGVGRS